MKICPKCNSQVADDAIFCTACGAKLEAETPVAEPVEAPASEPTSTPAIEPTAALIDTPVATPTIESTSAPTAESADLPAPDVKNTTAETTANTSATTSTTTPANKTNKKILIIILAIIAAVSLLIGIGAIIFSIITIVAVSSDTTGTGGSGTGTSITAGDGDVSASGIKVALGKYEVTIPGEYQYEMSDENLLISDEEGKSWMIGLQYRDDVTFSLIKNNINQFAANLIGEDGITEAVPGVEKLGNTEIPYTDASNGVDKVTYAFFPADDLHIFLATMIDASGDYNHDLMKNAQKVLSTAKKKVNNKGANDNKLFRKLDKFSDTDID